MHIPNIYIFNPTCDMAIANNTNSFIPKQYLKQFENDLSYLPFLLAKNTDIIAVEQYEDLDFIDKLHKIGFPTPGQILKSELFDPKQKIISEINHFIPWGWSPNIRHQIRKASTIKVLNKPSPWSQKERNLYSRSYALKCLKSILDSRSSSIYIPNSYSPYILSNLDEVFAFIKKHKQVVLKEPWSSSGKGVLFIKKQEISEGHIQRFNSILKQQGYIMGEIMLDKITDMALHFHSDGKQIAYIGESYFKTNESGQYQSNLINQKPDIEEEQLNFINIHLDTLKTDLEKMLNQSDIKNYYKGFFGVDIMLVRLNDKICFQPCVEINLRNNMGTLALHIQELIHPLAKGQFHISLSTDSKPEDSFDSWCEKLEFKEHKVIKGIIPLVNPKEKKFGAYIHLE